MAAAKQDIEAKCAEIISNAKAGIFKPVYLLMGDESYYPDLVCQAIIDNCVDEASKDFNEIICYGSDVTADQIGSAARQYPMMSDRVLVVVKDANQCKTLEQLTAYVENPLDSTVLVLLMRGASADKRKGLYKAVSRMGEVVDSPALRDYEIPRWIASYYSSRGLQIDPPAAELLAESVGTKLPAIVVETDKMLGNLPEGTRNITVQDVERNVGVSREFSIFELTKLLSEKNAPKALKVAARIGEGAKFAMPMAVSALYTHFSRILRYGALLQSGNAGPQEKAKALAGVNPYFYREYDQAVRNYPVPKAMQAVSLLCEYDYLGKGGDGGNLAPGELLVELTAKLLNL